MYAPASGMEHYHNAFPGGYVDHVIRVFQCAHKVYESWGDMGADMSGYTPEELSFAAIKPRFRENWRYGLSILRTKSIRVASKESGKDI